MERYIKRVLSYEVCERLEIDSEVSRIFNRNIEQMVHLPEENLARYLNSLDEPEKNALKVGFTKLVEDGQNLDDIEFTTLLGGSPMATGKFKVDRRSKLSDIWKLVAKI